jgi:unsaturated chondroitin disaccharide hydrolase
MSAVERAAERLPAALVADAQARVLARIDETAVALRPAFPHAADGTTGRWQARPGGAWTDGFWVGLCWLAYRLTGTDRYRAWGLEWAARLRGREQTRTHDIGFLFHYAAVLGWQTVREPMLRELGLACADQLVAMWHPRARVIPVGAHAEVSSGLDDVTIDCMMNLQVLWWAARETGDARYGDVALAHAERTAAWHVRDDGACVQSVHFDPATGEALRTHTHQGHADTGCWSRGLGWCAYGFVEASRATGRQDFLAIAQNALEYHIRRTPRDPVTFNDYDDPRIPDAPRDTSAAAILASAALALEEVGATPPGRYRDEAARILGALVRGFLTPLGADDDRPPGMLLHTCYNLHTGEAPDHELIWGDYFLLEALARWQGRGAA